MQHVNLPLSPPRLFAALCVMGILAIAYGAAAEMSRQKRGNTLVSPRQYRIRLISAAVWMVILTANFYAVTALWPEEARYLPNGRLTPESKAQAQLFIKVIGGSFSLVFVGLGLFVLDMRHTARERQALELKRQKDFAELTSSELMRANLTPNVPSAGTTATENVDPLGS